MYKVTWVDIEDSYIIYKLLEVYIIPPKLLIFPLNSVIFYSVFPPE